MVNMFLHDFQYNLVDQQSSAALDVESNDDLDDNLCTTREDVPLVEFRCVNEAKRRKYDTITVPEVPETSEVEVPVVSRQQFVQSRKNGKAHDPPLLVILEPRPFTAEDAPTVDDDSGVVGPVCADDIVVADGPVVPDAPAADDSCAAASDAPIATSDVSAVDDPSAGDAPADDTLASDASSVEARANDSPDGSPTDDSPAGDAPVDDQIVDNDPGMDTDSTL